MLCFSSLPALHFISLPLFSIENLSTSSTPNPPNHHHPSPSTSNHYHHRLPSPPYPISQPEIQKGKNAIHCYTVTVTKTNYSHSFSLPNQANAFVSNRLHCHAVSLMRIGRSVTHNTACLNVDAPLCCPFTTVLLLRTDFLVIFLYSSSFNLHQDDFEKNCSTPSTYSNPHSR